MLLFEERLTKNKTYKFLQEVRVYIEIIVRAKGTRKLCTGSRGLEKECSMLKAEYIN